MAFYSISASVIPMETLGDHISVQQQFHDSFKAIIFLLELLIFHLNTHFTYFDPLYCTITAATVMAKAGHISKQRAV